MAQTIKCDAPDCREAADYLIGNLKTGKQEALCAAHYEGKQPAPVDMTPKICTMEGCAEPAEIEIRRVGTDTRDVFCGVHYTEFIFNLANTLAGDINDGLEKKIDQKAPQTGETEEDTTMS